jgi:hypothetical protein
MEARWKAIIAWSEPEVARSNAGRACHRPTVDAAEEFLKLGREAEAREIIATALALFLMQFHWEPRRFKSDRGFRFQLVRRVRALAELNVMKIGKRRVYRELPPRTTEIMAQRLKEAFGPAGVQLAEMERKDEERKRAEVLALRTAIKELA